MFGESDAGRERRSEESRARTKAEHTRQTLLGLLRGGPMSATELRQKLAPDASMSVVNYHLSVLAGAGALVAEDGLYRLA